MGNPSTFAPEKISQVFLKNLPSTDQGGNHPLEVASGEALTFSRNSQLIAFSRALSSSHVIPGAMTRISGKTWLARAGKRACSQATLHRSIATHI